MAAKDDEYCTVSEEEHILYRDRPDWKDVIPLPQNNGPHSVVRIAYTDAFEDVYDYFRAISYTNELSQRALSLTEDAIQLNPANYTVWQYRRKILTNINADLEKELFFCREMIEMHPKNYQVWHHRRMVVDLLGDPSNELLLTKIVFSSDAKNYHAWEHRQWVLKTYNLFEGELDYIDELLLEDIRNNSAWNQRFFIISNTTGFTPDAVAREISYAQKAIEKQINNESPWNYLRGVLIHNPQRLSNNQELIKWTRNLSSGKDKNCPFLLSFLLEVLEDKMESQTGDHKDYLEQAFQICEDLASEYDKIRQEYWRYQARRLSHKFS